MRIVKAAFEVIPQSESYEGIYKQIEIAGRTCYKSEDKITETSAKEFVERMIKSGHGAMLEHGTVYLTHPVENSGSPSYLGIGVKYRENKYSKVNYDNWGTRYITTNYRVLVENNWLYDLRYLCEPTEYHEKRTTVRFICDRGVSHEFVRHRVFSFAQESTRCCNYAKDKFGNEITIVAPDWLDFAQLESISSSDRLNQLTVQKVMELLPIHEEEVSYLYAMAQAEQNYFKLISKGWTPQQARSVLPNSLKTELVMTGFNSDWESQLREIMYGREVYKYVKGFLGLRDSDSAHSQARELAKPLHAELLRLKVITK